MHYFLLLYKFSIILENKPFHRVSSFFYQISFFKIIFKILLFSSLHEEMVKYLPFIKGQILQKVSISTFILKCVKKSIIPILLSWYLSFEISDFSYYSYYLSMILFSLNFFINDGFGYDYRSK